MTANYLTLGTPTSTLQTSYLLSSIFYKYYFIVFLLALPDPLIPEGVSPMFIHFLFFLFAILFGLLLSA